MGMSIPVAVRSFVNALSSTVTRLYSKDNLLFSNRIYLLCPLFVFSASLFVY